MIKRVKTDYPGVYYREARRIGGKGNEKIYYIRFKKDGKVIEEKVGRHFVDDMTPARASKIRSDRIEGKRLSRKEIRQQQEEAEKAAKRVVWTIGKLFDAYIKTRPDNKSRIVDKNRYEKHLNPVLGKKRPEDLAPLDIDRIRINLLKKLSPQTVKHVLNLLTWTINYGVKKNLCSGLSFHVQKPTVNNIVTEDLNPNHLKSLIEAIEADSNIQIKNLMKLALSTGMRRGELFKLQWDHINFERGFINIVDPKGGPDQTIPLNDSARKILESHPKTFIKREKMPVYESPYVFPGSGGKQRVSAQAGVNRIKKRAGLPKNFRPLHGLRHVYASMLASSGKVDMYTLQKLLTHKSPLMTQRYAHLRDETLKNASNVAGNIIDEITKNEKIIKKKNA
jgi:integrase